MLNQNYKDGMMRPAQALKSRIKEESQHKEVEGTPSLLDVLRKHNRELEIPESRRVLLKRIRVR